MTNKLYDDSNWREEYKAYTSNERHLELLEKGPDSLSSSWILQALYGKWKKMSGFDEEHIHNILAPKKPKKVIKIKEKN